MTGTDVGIVAFCGFVLIAYGVYKNASAEKTAYDEVVLKVKDLQAQNIAQARKIEEFQADLAIYKATVQSARAELDDMAKDVEQCQEHMGRLRKSQIELRDRSYPRQVELKVQSGAIPVEIYTPSKTNKALVKKVQKQVKELSK